MVLEHEASLLLYKVKTETERSLDNGERGRAKDRPLLWKWMTEQKTPFSRNALQCCVYVPVNDSLLKFSNGEAGIYVFILCCISAFLPKTDANKTPWDAFLKDLNKLKTLIKSSDATFYSGSDEINGGEDEDACRKVVFRCYLMELDAIVWESKMLGKEIEDNLMQHLRTNSCENQHHEETDVNVNCKKCEQLPEKSYVEFIEDLETFVQALFVQKKNLYCQE